MKHTQDISFPIYLDHHATTPVDPRVAYHMMEVFRENYGNSSSTTHQFGKNAANLVEDSRVMIASIINVPAQDLIFTSGGTESNNLAITGSMMRYRTQGAHAITTQIEHPSVLEPFKQLEREGFRVTYLPVSKDGFVSPEDVKNAITDDTVLISVMTANNEIGTIQPVEEIGKIAKEHNILFHTDASQAVGKIMFNAERIQADLVSFSSHKLYGPKGVGALYVRGKNPHVRLTPIMHGGGQERELRPGTLNVAGIAGFAEAVHLCKSHLMRDSDHTRILRDRLLSKIQSSVDDIQVNGSMENRLPNNLNISFAYVEGESLLRSLEDIAVSSSSACSSNSQRVSYVLKAIGLSERFIHTSIRIGVGRFNTEEEIDYAAAYIAEKVKQLRDLSTLYQIAKNTDAEYRIAKKPENFGNDSSGKS